MPKPGVFNEGLLRGLDYFLAEARKRGIKASERRRTRHTRHTLQFRMLADASLPRRAACQRRSSSRSPPTGCVDAWHCIHLTARLPQAHAVHACAALSQTPAGGVDSFANATGASHNDFFTAPAPKALFKDYVKAIVTRTNTIIGLKYSDDATIM